MASLLADLGWNAAGLSRLLLAMALIAARVVPIFTFAPTFGGRLLPGVVRVAVSLAFAALLVPAVGQPAVATWGQLPGAVAIAVLFAKEIAVGVALAFVVSLPFVAVDVAGRLADVARGASQAQVLVPQTGERTTPLGDFGLQLAIALFFLLGGHLLVLDALAASYEAVPIAGLPAASGWWGIARVSIDASAHMFAVAIGLAAPVLAATFLADLALGLVNRVAPQVQVYFVGMPAKAVLGVFAFMLALAAVAVTIAHDTLGGARAVVEAMRGLGR
ncbi:MAG: type III secretion protein [Deltaproteobacteria bacterium]|nr:MAG: type III secretion protein [Deltaproteobacteria bacterium]